MKKIRLTMEMTVTDEFFEAELKDSKNECKNVINSVCSNCDVDMTQHKNETKHISGRRLKSYFSIQYYCNDCGYVSYPKPCL